MSRTLIAILLVSLSQSGWAEPDFLGTWVVNPELSAEAQPEHAGTRWWEGLGSFSTSVNVGGIPVPVGSSRPASSGDTPPNPDMLRCSELKVEQLTDKELLLTYVDVDDEKIRKGNYRGMRSKWSRKKLTSNYESTSRKVNRTLEMRSDGRLLMTVKLNPNKGKTRIFKRVFDRQAS